MGYSRAGFEVVGVDIKPQPRYPFAYVEADALEFARETLVNGWTENPKWEFDAIHASPPCQQFTAYKRARPEIVERYENLIPQTRELLRATGLPYVIENVSDAPLEDPVTLCGSMFDLDVRRHRLFETNWGLEPPWMPCRHGIWGRRFKSSSTRKNLRFSIEVGAWDEPLERQKAAMGVDWEITVEELSEAIPPAYTEFIGHQLMSHLKARAAA